MAAVSSLFSNVRRLASFFYTLFLFTKSDTPLVIFPMVRAVRLRYSQAANNLKIAVALVLAGPTDWSSFLIALIWLELHLLAFDVSNVHWYEGFSDAFP